MKHIILIITIVVAGLLSACSIIDPDPFEGVGFIGWEFVPGETVSFEGDMYIEYGKLWIITNENKAYLFLSHEFRYLLANNLILRLSCIGRIREGDIQAKVNLNATPSGTRLEIITESDVFDHCEMLIQYPNLVPTREENPVSQLFEGRLDFLDHDTIHLIAEDETVYAFQIWELDQLDFVYTGNETTHGLSLFGDWSKFQNAISVLSHLVIERDSDFMSLKASILFIVSIEENAALFYQMKIQSPDPILQELIEEIGLTRNETK